MGFEEDEIKGKKRTVTHVQDVLAYWMCCQQVQQTEFHPKQLRIFRAWNRNSARPRGRGKHRKRNANTLLQKPFKKEKNTSWCEIKEGLIKEMLPQAGPCTVTSPSVSVQRGRRRTGQREGGARHEHVHPELARPSSKALSLFISVNKGLIVKQSWVCSKNEPPCSPGLELKAWAGDWARLQWVSLDQGRGVLLLLTQWGAPGGVWAEKWPEESCDLEKLLW